MAAFIQREKAFPGSPEEQAAAAFAAHMSGEGAREYVTSRPKIVDGDVVATWGHRRERVADVTLDVAGRVLSTEEVAAMLGAEVTLDAAHVPEPAPVVTAEDARKARVAERLHEQAREAMKRNDVDTASTVVALMSAEERTKWQAPTPEEDAAADRVADVRASAFVEARGKD